MLEHFYFLQIRRKVGHLSSWNTKANLETDVVEDEEGGEHEDEGEHLKSREGTEESELSLVVGHPEERSASQNKS